MLISNKKKFIFIHIPKTGGTSLRTSLEAYTDVGEWRGFTPHGHARQKNKLITKHGYAINAMKVLGNTYNKYFSFCIVRNPWDWLVSIYFFSRIYRRDTKHQIANSLLFPEFVEWFCDQSPRIYPVVGGQLPYISKNGSIIVNKVYKLENFKNVCKDISRILGIHISTNKLNSSKHRHYTEYYTQKTQKFVQKLFKKDIDKFGYRF